MKTILALLFSAAAITATTAAPVPSTPGTPTAGLAKRSFASGSTTCYFECPATAYSGLANGPGAGFQDGSTYYCAYAKPGQGPFGVFALCPYDTSAGGAIDNQAGDCPAMAAGPFCGTKPTDGGAYFKRDSTTRFKRELTEAELAIQKRQYVPPTVKRDQQEQAPGDQV